MKRLDNYITEKLKINKETISADKNKGDIIIDRDNQITKDFRKLYKMISDEWGPDCSILDSLVAMSDFDDDYDEFYYQFDDDKWFYFLRDVVNYDLISLGKNGAVDVNNSNRKDIANMIKKYNVLPIGKKVYDSFR